MLRNKVSVCITIFNEKVETVQKLLQALNNQTLKPDEIIVVDATTNYKLQSTNHKQFPSNKLQIINRIGVSRSEGRNIAIKKAKKTGRTMMLFPTKIEVKIKSNNPKKMATASERPMTMEVKRPVSRKLGQLTLFSSCHDSCKNNLILPNIII